MRLEEVHVRDPFILPFEGKYYLCGTRSATCWGRADGFDGYVSSDLVNWEGPFELFRRTEGFEPDENYWAPEFHFYKGRFYIFATFGISSKHHKGTMILSADTPLGPYHLHSDGYITPDAWNCLDGTFYVAENGDPYMVFSHEWLDIGDGQMCRVRLSGDLTHAVGEPVVLFSASEAKPWVRPLEDERWSGDAFVTDGPFLCRSASGDLIMLWASFGDRGYAEGIVRSDNGEIDGNWSVDSEPLFAEDGGHGMVFTAFDGKRYLVLHQPNITPQEHPVLIPFAL